MRQGVLEINKELVDRARSLIPTLRERGEETEKYNRIPEATIQELKDNGLLKVLRPKMFGGYQTNMRTYTEVVTEISTGRWIGWMVRFAQ